MKTSNKLIIWSITILLGFGVWEYAKWTQTWPSGVHEAVIVEINGCSMIDLGICRTTVDFLGTRLIRNGDHGEIGDTILATMYNRTSWTAPSSRQMRKYREELRRQLDEN